MDEELCRECNHPKSEHSEHDDWMCTRDWEVDIEGCECSGFQGEEAPMTTTGRSKLWKIE